MATDNRIYANSTGGYAARPTKADPDGMACDTYGEQYKRDNFEDRPPIAWGLKHYKTGKLTRVRNTRAEVRSIRKPTERVVAIWL